MADEPNACVQHGDLPLEFYCLEEGCSKAICKRCIPDHPKHHIVLNEDPPKAPTAEETKAGATTSEDLGKTNAFTGDLVWCNDSKVFKHDQPLYEYQTATSKTRLPAYFSVTVKMQKLKEQTGTFIGISRRNVGNKVGYRLCREDDNQYALCNFGGGRKFCHCDEWKTYGSPYKEGDTVTITLDPSKVLSFAVNGHNCGVAFTNLKGYFYLAATTNCTDNALEIINVKSL